MQVNAKVVKINGYENVPKNKEKALKKAVASQVVSAGISTGSIDFQLYKSVSSSSFIFPLNF